MADQRQAGSLWTPEEDVVLLRHVAKYGTKHWGYLQGSGVLPHRDQKACCNRFILLKRKFFQARAKGQRLTFPVCPQLDVSSSPRPAPSSLDRRSASLSLPKLSVSVPNTLKRATAGSVAAPPVFLSSGFTEGDLTYQGTRMKFPGVTTLAGRSAAADVPQARGSPKHDVKQTEGPLEAFAEKMNTAAYEVEDKVLSKDNQTLQAGRTISCEVADAMPALVQAPETIAVPAYLPSVPENLPGAQGSAWASTMPAVWKCFSPSVPACPLPRGMGMQDFPREGELNRQAADVTQSRSLSPDALMDQIASDPVRMLFGVPSSQEVSSALEACSAQDGFSIWDSPSCADLFDVLRSSASI